MAATSLNPSAPEFFPNCYNQTQMQFHCCVNPFTHHFNLPLTTSSPFFPSPNLNYNPSFSPCISHSPFFYCSITNTCTINNNNPKNQPYPLVLPPPVTEPPYPPTLIHVAETEIQTQLVHEPEEEVKVVTAAVSPSGGKKRGDGCYKNRKGGLGGGVNGNYYGNGRAKGCCENQSVKKVWQAKNDHPDGERNCITSSSIRHARSSFGGSRHKHNNQFPIVPINCDGQNTTVMIRNIPNRYTRGLLMEFLDNHCMLENEKANKLQNNERVMSAFDFLYLPMDFGNKANKGYAFVNFTEPGAAWKFHLAVNNQRWGLFQSGKICKIARARLQGKEELERHFESSSFECETDDWLPVSFSPPRDGSKAMVKQRIIGRRIG